MRLVNSMWKNEQYYEELQTVAFQSLRASYTTYTSYTLHLRDQVQMYSTYMS